VGTNGREGQPEDDTHKPGQTCVEERIKFKGKTPGTSQKGGGKRLKRNTETSRPWGSPCGMKITEKGPCKKKPFCPLREKIHNSVGVINAGSEWYHCRGSRQKATRTSRHKRRKNFKNFLRVDEVVSRQRKGRQKVLVFRREKVGIQTKKGAHNTRSWKELKKHKKGDRLSF